MYVVQISVVTPNGSEWVVHSVYTRMYADTTSVGVARDLANFFNLHTRVLDACDGDPLYTSVTQDGVYKYRQTPASESVVYDSERAEDQQNAPPHL